MEPRAKNEGFLCESVVHRAGGEAAKEQRRRAARERAGGLNAAKGRVREQEREEKLQVRGFEASRRGESEREGLCVGEREQEQGREVFVRRRGRSGARGSRSRRSGRSRSRSGRSGRSAANLRGFSKGEQGVRSGLP